MLVDQGRRAIVLFMFRSSLSCCQAGFQWPVLRPKIWELFRHPLFLLIWAPDDYTLRMKRGDVSLPRVKDCLSNQGLMNSGFPLRFAKRASAEAHAHNSCSTRSSTLWVSFGVAPLSAYQTQETCSHCVPTWNLTGAPFKRKTVQPRTQRTSNRFHVKRVGGQAVFARHVPSKIDALRPEAQQSAGDAVDPNWSTAAQDSDDGGGSEQLAAKGWIILLLVMLTAD